MSKLITISAIGPKGFIHSKCFDPVISVLQQSFSVLGYGVSVLNNQLAESETNIVIGAHLLDDPLSVLKNPKAVIYNFEQFCKDSRAIKDSYIKALSERTYWDYSRANDPKTQLGVNGLNGVHVPFSYSSILDYSFVYKKSYSTKRYNSDVLFYGSMNDRRQHIIDEMVKTHGLNVKAVYGIYDEELSALVNDSKLVLNMHFYDNKIFESVRVLPLLASAIPVVTEKSIDDDDYDFLCGGMANAEYDDLPKVCAHLIRDDSTRLQMALLGRDKVKARYMTSVLKQVGF